MERIAQAAALASTLALGMAFAQQPTPPQGQQQQTESIGTPRELVSKLHIVNVEEIRAGQLAEEKGSTDSVKEYGQRLIQDHQQNDEKLQQFAEAQGISWNENPELPPEKQQMLQRLEGLDGQAFDRAFLQEMEAGHEKAIQMLTGAQDRLTDAEAREIVTSTLPVIREHMEIAQGLQRETE